MTNKELEKKLCSAFEEATPDVLGSVLADCRKEQKTMKNFKSNVSIWNKKFAITAAAAILVICLSLGMGNIFGGIDPTDPYGPGTQPTGTHKTEPLVHVLDADMYFTVIDRYGESPAFEYESPFKMVITEFAGGEVTTELDMTFPSDWSHTANGSRVRLWNEDAGLPFYSTKVEFVEGDVANGPYDCLVDFEKEYVLFYICSNSIRKYIAGSSDPDVDTDTVLDHFKDLYLLEGHEHTELLQDLGYKPTIPEGFPSDLDIDALTVKWFQKRFDNLGDRISEWNVALCQSFDDPRNMDLKKLFYNGCPVNGAAVHTKEREALEEMVGKIEANIVRCDPAKMDIILNRMFGLTLADFAEDVLDDFVYLESTGCYYLIHDDTFYAHDLRVYGIRKPGDGTVEVYYTYDGGATRGVVTLEPFSNNYHIVSNRYI